MSVREDIARTFGLADGDAFLDFLVRADGVITRVAGLGLLDFDDACWADLFEDGGTTVSAEAICETLAEADDSFADIWALRA